jgi:Protein of unknown function (DUF1524)/Excalibur calcium-binding domain
VHVFRSAATATVFLAFASVLVGCDSVGSPTLLTHSSTAEPSKSASTKPSQSLRPLVARSSVAPTGTSAGAPKPTAANGTALATLARLKVKGRAAKTGYSRAAFGPAWYDANGNGCDTRDDVLRRDLTALHSSGCTVLSGTIADPYTGNAIHFVRAGAYVNALDIDHVVALGDAWQTGAAYWTFAKRVAFANDLTNLLAVDPSENRQKGDADAASWLPPRKAFRCAYVARQVDVKAGYGLWVTAAEKSAMTRVLTTCPGQLLPGKVHLTVAGTPTATATKSPSPSTHGLDPRFSTCKEAKAHGYGPYRRGVDPEYAWYRDADGDGVDCE